MRPSGATPAPSGSLAQLHPRGTASRTWTGGSAGGRAGSSPAARVPVAPRGGGPRRRASLLWEWVSLERIHPYRPCGLPEHSAA